MIPIERTQRQYLCSIYFGLKCSPRVSCVPIVSHTDMLTNRKLTSLAALAAFWLEGAQELQCFIDDAMQILAHEIHKKSHRQRAINRAGLQ
jgi:hypothetical protein